MSLPHRHRAGAMAGGATAQWQDAEDDLTRLRSIIDSLDDADEDDAADHVPTIPLPKPDAAAGTAPSLR